MGCLVLAEVPAFAEMGRYDVLQSSAEGDRAVADTVPVRGNSAGYVAFIVVVTFKSNMPPGKDTRADSLSMPLTTKELRITTAQSGFAQMISNWVGLLGGALIMADGLWRKPAFVVVLFGFSPTAPLTGMAGSFGQ
jgi:hypothetical protein